MQHTGVDFNDHTVVQNYRFECLWKRQKQDRGNWSLHLVNTGASTNNCLCARAHTHTFCQALTGPPGFQQDLVLTFIFFNLPLSLSRPLSRSETAKAVGSRALSLIITLSRSWVASAESSAPLSISSFRTAIPLGDGPLWRTRTSPPGQRFSSGHGNVLKGGSCKRQMHATRGRCPQTRRGGRQAEQWWDSSREDATWVFSSLCFLVRRRRPH